MTIPGSKIAHAARLLTGAALLVPAISLPVAAGPTLELFTADEARGWNAPQPNGPQYLQPRDYDEDAGQPTCHAIPDTHAAADPEINILAPSLDKPLAAPLDIELQFVPSAKVAIRPDTFRVCYVGWVTMDITKRITDHVTVSPAGLHVTGAQLPHGHHRLVILIADQEGHVAHRDATFDIQ